jgi:Flp pilus assembly protein TadG
LVEFALVAPILFLVLFGIIEFGIVLYDKAMITNAAREGARAGIVYDLDDKSTSDTSDDTYHPPDSEIATAVQYYCENYLITSGSGTLDYPTITRTGDGSGDLLTVEVNYNYEFFILPSFLSSLAGGIQLTAQSVMRME